MTKFTSLNYWYSLMLMLVTVSFTACVDDNDDTEAPFLEVAPTTLTFTEAGTPAEGSQSYFEIKTNRSWTATVQSDVEWVTLSKKAGEGNARVEVSVPGGVAGEAHIDVVVGNKAGELLKETVKVFRTSSSGPVETKVIYNETFGEGAKENDIWPNASTYTGWVTTGEGATSVSYAASTGTKNIRNSASNSSGYEGASAAGKFYFTSNAALIINNIALAEDQKNLKLTFGSAYYDYDSKDNVFKPEQLHVYLSADGSKWTEQDLTFTTAEAGEGWVFATADFTLKQSSATLSIKFAADVASKFSLDDVTLSTGIGGQEVDLNAGGTEPEPPTGTPIQQLIQMQKNGVTALTQDMTFEAIVSGDPDVCNASAGTIYIMTEGATTAGEGFVLYAGGALKDAVAEKLSLGDKISVTLKAGTELTAFNDAPQVKITDLDGISVISSGNTVTPIKVALDNMAQYVSMPVEVENVTATNAGTWASGTNNGFTVNGNSLVVYLNANATSIIGNAYQAATGSMCGIVSLFRGNPQICPRNLADVQAFASTTVAITGVNPNKLNFTAEGGEQKIAVTLANYNNEAITATGLSEGKFTVSVSGKEVTVKANPNEGAAINETLTIAVAGGNSVTVPVAVAAAGGQGGGEATYTLIDKVVNLQPGKYYMAGYRVNYENQGVLTDFSSHPYHVWNGTIKSSKDCDTDQYAFESGKLTAKDASKSLVEVELVAASGENAYYIKVGDKYLYSNTMSKPASRKLALTEDVTNAVWTFVDFEAGAMLPSNNGCSMITAGAQSALIRSYATDSSTVTGASYGIAFFKKN